MIRLWSDPLSKHHPEEEKSKWSTFELILKPNGAVNKVWETRAAAWTECLDSQTSYCSKVQGHHTSIRLVNNAIISPPMSAVAAAEAKCSCSTNPAETDWQDSHLRYKPWRSQMPQQHTGNEYKIHACPAFQQCTNWMMKTSRPAGLYNQYLICCSTVVISKLWMQSTYASRHTMTPMFIA